MNLGRAQRLMESGHFDGAAAALGPVDPSSPKDPRAVIVAARLSEARGELPQALADLDQLRRSRPDYAPGHLYYGIFAGDAGQPDAALQAFDRVLELQPANDVARSYRALALLQLGRDAEAVELLRTYGINDNRMYRVRLTEWMEQQWIDSGRFFGQQTIGLPVPALPLPEAPVRRRSRLARERAERQATRLLHAKRFPEMLQVLDSLILEGSGDAGVHFTAAIGAEMLGDYDRAISYLQLFQEERKDLPADLLAVRGRTLVRLRRFREAVDDLNAVDISGPEDFGTNYYFGVICLAHGERAQARRLFFRAHTQYLIDTLEAQWWQIERALFSPVASSASSQ